MPRIPIRVRTSKACSSQRLRIQLSGSKNILSKQNVQHAVQPLLLLVTFIISIISALDLPCGIGCVSSSGSFLLLFLTPLPTTQILSSSCQSRIASRQYWIQGDKKKHTWKVKNEQATIFQLILSNLQLILDRFENVSQESSSFRGMPVDHFDWL